MRPIQVLQHSPNLELTMNKPKTNYSTVKQVCYNNLNSIDFECVGRCFVNRCFVIGAPGVALKSVILRFEKKKEKIGSSGIGLNPSFVFLMMMGDDAMRH